MIKQVEQFHCERCDYITVYPPVIEEIKRTEICPACNNGKPKRWSLEGKSVKWEASK